MTSEKKTLFIIVRSKAKGVNVQVTSPKSRLHSPPPTNASPPSTNASPLYDRAVSPFTNANNVDHSNDDDKENSFTVLHSMRI